MDFQDQKQNCTGNFTRLNVASLYEICEYVSNFRFMHTYVSVDIYLSGLLAEDEGEVVFGLLAVPQVFETQTPQETHQTLVVYGELSP